MGGSHAQECQVLACWRKAVSTYLAPLELHPVLRSLHGPHLLVPQVVKAGQAWGAGRRQIIESPRLAAAGGSAQQGPTAALPAAGHVDAADLQGG